ncbi:MAG: helix-turn-helix domain-containing protein [Candidatus Altiarchaeota archaeon]
MGGKRIKDLPGEYCPVRQTIKLLGKRWTILIIKEIYYSSRHRLGFMELRKMLGDVSAKVLSERLKEMVEDGLANRRVDSSAKPERVYYTLTGKGKDACKIVEEMREYGLHWGDRKTYDCSKKDCELCVKERESRIREHA